MHGIDDLLKMMSMHTGDWPLPAGVARPTLPPIPIVRQPMQPGAAGASTARPTTAAARSLSAGRLPGESCVSCMCNLSKQCLDDPGSVHRSVA